MKWNCNEPDNLAAADEKASGDVGWQKRPDITFRRKMH